MSEPLWWQTGVVYQVYPRSFQDSNGDGVGDLAGVIRRLDHLSDVLGVDAVWLSPFYPSPMADFGYDVADYCDVDPLFGSLEDFDRLVAEAHRRELRVIIDWVPNHTSSEHPWFRESRSSRESPKRDWYLWRDPGPGGSPPNNWLSVFGGSAWEWDRATGQYYLHSFLSEQPDLDWRNPEVREAMLDTLRFWLERGVDGFRVDVAHLVMKDPELRDNPPDPAGESAFQTGHAYEHQLHVYDQNHPDCHDLYREVRALLDEYSDRPRVAIGEIHIFDWPAWATYFGEGDEFHLPFCFGLLRAPWEVEAVRGVVDGVEAALPEGALPNYVLGNHDESRVASRQGPARARVAAMLLLTLRGTPTVYYGDEIGMTDVAVPEERIRDPFGQRVPDRSRDPARTPMQWDGGPNAGFCPTGVEPWLPVGGDHGEVNVARQLADPRSMLALHRRLVDLRRRTPALHRGSYRPIEVSAEGCFAYLREAEGRRILVALNLTGRLSRVVLPDLPPEGTVLLSTHLDREGPTGTDPLELRADEGVVVEPAG